MKIISASLEKVERVVVVSYPGDPDLVALLTNDKLQWTIDWREGGLHGDPTDSLRRYCIKRSTSSVLSEVDIQKLFASAQPPLVADENDTRG